MRKDNVLIMIIIFLVIVIIVQTLICFFLYNKSKINMENLIQINKKITELEEKTKDLNSMNVVNSNSTVSSEPYIPDGINSVSPNYKSDIKAEDVVIEHAPEEVTIEVIADTVTRESAEILIKDNNENKYGWSQSFKLQKKINDNWEDMIPINDLIFTAMGHTVNENNELIMKIDYKKYYGLLENGIYRIVKTVYDNKYIDLYSNEFEIK